MSSLKLSILSPERRYLENTDIEEVTLNGSEGQIQILPGHAPMVGTLESGSFSFRTSSGQRSSGTIAAGFFEVRQENVYVLAESMEMKSDGAAAEAGAHA